MSIEIPLSQLSAGRRNPRRVQPERDAHRRLVASIRSVGLLQPLIVRPVPEADGYRVVAGKRRLEALRAVHRGTGTDPMIRCELRDVDDATADSMALAENFAREGMHPLDEAVAFARLAVDQDKGVADTAAEFGVTPRYVRQRMMLAGLHDTLKDAYRDRTIDTGTAEAFSVVSPDRQIALWQETNGNVRDAHHVRRLIRNENIDAKLARFDLDVLPEDAVSRDLFSESVWVDRAAFMEAQTTALLAEADDLTEDGWGEVVVGSRNDVFVRLQGMDHPASEFDAQTTDKLGDLTLRMQDIEEQIEGFDEGGDEEVLHRLYEQYEEVEEEHRDIENAAEAVYSEATKAVGTVFLILDPDGRVEQEVRVPRPEVSEACGVNGGKATNASPPTADDVSERQREAAFAHETIAVRAALSEGQAQHTRKVLLAMMLSDGTMHEGLGVVLYADPVSSLVDRCPEDKPFRSEAWDTLTDRDKQVNPFHGAYGTDTVKAYTKLSAMSDRELDDLIDLLLIQRVSGSLDRRNPLIVRLVRDLGVSLRDYWTPDTSWFNGYKKIQLADLIGQLLGESHGVAAAKRKKSELVEMLALLFRKARLGKLDDDAEAQRVNAWLPACVAKPRAENEVHPETTEPAKQAA